MAENKFIETSVVDVNFEKKDGKTELMDRYFTAPFKIVKPFRQDNGFLRVMVMSSSGGIMTGDRQEFRVNVGEGCCGEIISQSYEKIFKMTEDGHAERRAELIVEKNAILNYMPQPTIPFAESAFKNHTEVRLADESSKLLFHEILTAGRVARDEIFDYRFYDSLTRIFVGDKMIYRDNAKFNPAKFNMEGYGLFEGYTHLSNLVLVNLGDGEELATKVREILGESKEDIIFGASVIASGDVVIRVLGREGNALELLNQKIVDAVVPDNMI